MLGRLISFFEGRVRLYADSENKDRFVNAVLVSGVRAEFISDAQNGGVCAVLSPQNAKKIASTLDKSNIIVYINSVCGFKAELISRCKRFGLLLGAVTFFTLLWLSTLFVFKVEVSGSEFISVQSVKAELSDFGIRTGARLSDIDRNAVSNRFLQLHPELSWAAISFKGTTVRLELKEKTEGQEQPQTKADFLVAGCDGVVKNVLVYSGKSMVLPGTAVKKGDLLISGYVSGNGLQYSDNPALRYEGASGSVSAEVTERVYSYVPFNESVSKSQIKERVGTSVEFFGKTVTFGKVEDSEKYRVMSEKNLTLWGKIELPITYKECYEYKTTSVTVTRDEFEADSQSRAKAYQMLAQALLGASLCETQISSGVDENGAWTQISYVCVREIAVQKMKDD